MNKNIIVFLSVILIIFAVVTGWFIWDLNTGKEDRNPAPDGQPKIQALVSILPQLEVVECVGGAFVAANELIHPGDSPATYTLTANDLKTISSSDIYFRIGHIPFEEANILKITDTNPELKVVDITPEIKLRDFEEDEAHEHKEGENGDEHGDEHEDEHEREEPHDIDPHLWLSIDNMKKHAASVAAELSVLRPNQTEYFAKNLKQYHQQLDELHEDIKAELETLKGSHLLVFHPSWGYFARDYSLEQLAIEHDGKEPTAKQLADIIQKAKKENVTVIFVQEQFSTNAAETIAQELNATVVKIDPLAANYTQNMRQIAKTLAENLSE